MPEERTYQERLSNSLTAGIKKAVELGYELKEMQISVSAPKDMVCTMNFTPLPEPGALVLGGDLSLTLDLQAERVTKVARGQ